VVPGCQRKSARIAGRDLFQSKVSARFLIVTGQAYALQVAILIVTTLRHRHDVVNLLRQRQPTTSLAGLAESEVTAQDALPYLCPCVARLVAEALVVGWLWHSAGVYEPPGSALNADPT